MASLRVRDLVRSKMYLEPLSGYRVRVLVVTLRDAIGNPIQARCQYYNRLTGRFNTFLVEDGHLEPWEGNTCPHCDTEQNTTTKPTPPSP